MKVPKQHSSTQQDTFVWSFVCLPYILHVVLWRSFSFFVWYWCILCVWTLYAMKYTHNNFLKDTFLRHKRFCFILLSDTIPCTQLLPFFVRWSSIWIFNFNYSHSDFKSSSYVHQGIYTWVEVESPSKIERKKTWALHSEKLELSWHSFSYHYNVQPYGFHSVWVFSLILSSKVACTCSNWCTMTSGFSLMFFRTHWSNSWALELLCKYKRRNIYII